MEFDVTLVIPTFTKTEEQIEKTIECIKSHKDIKQVIIHEDGGNYSERLKNIANIYIYNNYNYGFTKCLNTAWKLSDSDFTIIANSDTYIESGNLFDLFIPDKVTCPIISNSELEADFIGSYFVVPKLIKDQYGLLDERMRMYFSDLEYAERIKSVFVKDPRVKIFHYKQNSINQVNAKILLADYNKDREVFFDILKNKYHKDQI